MYHIKVIPDTASSRRSHWLVVSVAVNLLLVGLILAWVVAQPDRRQPLVTWQRELAPSLSPSDADIVTGGADRIAAAQIAGDDAAHAEYAHLRALLAAEPLDPAALEQSLQAIGVIRKDEQANAQKVFLQELVTVSPDGRTKMLGAMERESHRWRPYRHP